MIIPENTLTVLNRLSEPLYCTLTEPAGSKAKPLVIIAHGFKGFRNYSFIPIAAQAFAQSEMIALRFCFSHNGMMDGRWLVQDEAGFASNTISREVEDTLDVVNAFIVNESFSSARRTWDGRIFLVGHSRGGGVVQIAGKELLESDSLDLQKVVGWNSIARFSRWTDRMRESWIHTGYLEITNQRTGQLLRMNKEYLIDLEQNSDRFSISQAANILADRLLLIHSEQDLTVPVSEVSSLYDQTDQSGSLVIIPNTTHTFGMAHPVDRYTAGLQAAIDTTLEWFRQ